MAPPPRWSMFPDHHSEVADLLEEDNLYFTFHHGDKETGHIKGYDTNVMGRFQCPNPNYNEQGWSSKKIAVWIRLYSGKRYNARVFHQRCKSCNWVSRPTLDDSYAERVAYRLKKWSNVEVERPFYGGKKGKPHKSELCEGCKNGHCAEGDLEELMGSLSLF
ncbi:zinc-binding domain-containing protein [Pochonia chlamydosporia 170]|uniref:Zinc-binding domain-containing protein n=1 Tax=Pochonia chlamydosporia 170 TaxID=1380566 RepID=A0A179FDN9_METCM|nr:zinc-binding domain-containing protein [Pochonia chlamydosporia 170]OAQ63497.1 zinc-binding domain-containing protein [Pochonia chlamydosporia 170]